MSAAIPEVRLTLASRVEHVFPALTPAQIARVAAHGQVRQVERGEVLQETGEQAERLFVVTAGRIEMVRPSGDSEELVAVLPVGQFTGEVNILSGRRRLLRVRAVEPGEVIEVDREQLLTLVQTDSELSDILMRAFILRRLELIARGFGDVVLIGSSYSAGTLRIKEFLTRNGHPYSYIDLDRDAGVQEMLDRFHVAAADVPVVICRGEVVLRNPSNQQIAEVLGFNEAINRTRLRDLLIVGAGSRGARGGRLRRIGGTGCPRPGSGLAGGTGRLELQDRELPRLSNGHLGTGVGRAGVCPGAEVRGRGDHRARRNMVRLRPEAVCDRDRQRSPRGGAHDHHRDGR
jgi:CRP-like cAMP-binding protein